MSEHICREGGYLVGTGHWLPSDPREYFGSQYGLFAVGCNPARSAYV